MPEQHLFWVWLAEKLGPKNGDARDLILKYGGAYELFLMSEDEIDRLENVTSRTRRKLAEKDLEHAHEIIDLCKRRGVGILPFDDPSYPKALRDITNPPIVLYYRGELPNFDKHLAIGIVGTRRMSRYGLRAAYKFSHELAGANVLVVSGMATGVDGVAAASAIAAGGKTVAVLGCGVDVVYPKNHEKLAGEIAAHGVLLSEYPPGTRPNQYQFPARNRIISGMSQGTLVIEAGVKSGSLITANEANLQGRQVFAVPANIDGAAGTNELIHKGAQMVLRTEDILSYYRQLYRHEIDEAGLEEVSRHSSADLKVLDSFGVIELIPPREETLAVKPEERYELPQTKKQTKKKTEKKETEKKETEPAPAPTTRKSTAQKEMECARENPVPPPKPLPSNLTPIQLAILQAMPDGRPITAESLITLRYPHGDIIGALTMLEIYGLIQKLPGAFYLKS